MDGGQHLGRVPGADLLVIKPSGVAYDELSAANMVVCDLDGHVVEGDHRPSSDTAASAYIYRHLPGGRTAVVHTHSTYATAWASRGEAVPCVLTAMADEFGGEIPVGPFARIGDEEIGARRRRTLGEHRSKAVLLQNHGVFTIGATARAAVKAAVMCEDVARTVHIARQLGEPIPIAQPTSTPCTTATRTTTANESWMRLPDRRAAAGPQVWFLTGSQDLYGPETLAQVEVQSRGIVERLGAALGPDGRWCGSRCSPRRRRSGAPCSMPTVTTAASA